LGDRNGALNDFNKALELDPHSVRIFNRRAGVFYHSKEYAKALRDHMEALKLEPNSAETFNSLAWLWSTVPDPTIRNGRRAVDCATRACELTEFTNPNFLDTLAAANRSGAR
jgi:serine/threonine-protein kinase